MPSAANGKSEKTASSEAMDNTPVRQIMTVIEHKIRNLEKRKSKLTSYRDLQKAGKELNSDQKVAVAKYDEVVQTLEFARDLSKQITGIATSAEREAKKQAKKEAWIRYAADSNKIREVLLILDCLVQMGSNEAREDFINGTNGACTLTEDDLKILDDLYPEVTPKHEVNEEGQPGFHIQSIKAAEHLYGIIDGKPKEVMGTTYARIKEIITAVHGCGYFDRSADAVIPEAEENHVPLVEEPPQCVEEEVESESSVYQMLPVPPAAAVVPPPAYPLRAMPPITLQEVEHQYFVHQYPQQQRPIAEVIGSQNFIFLQESEIDTPVGTLQPPVLGPQPSPPAPIPTQTFTNQHFVQLPGRGPDVGTPLPMPLPPQPHFAPLPEHAFPPQPMPPSTMGPPLAMVPPPLAASVPLDERPVPPAQENNDDEWKESRSPEREENGERKTQGQGDGQGRFRRYGRGSRGAPNGHRGRGAFQSRQGGDGYRGRHGGDYQGRPNKDGYQTRQYDGYQNRHSKDNNYQNRGGDDGYYGNGDTGESHHQSENGGHRDRYDNQSYGGGYKGRGRGAPRGPRGAPRAPRTHYPRKPENVE